MLGSTARGDGTVTLILESSVAGQQIAPGASVDWTIKVVVSSGDNQGLALISCDLIQDAANPGKLDIPSGNPSSIPAAMAGFDRPAGITNPGEGGAASGYVGVQRGTAGAKNLVQIGGAQNTFGQAGTVFGTDPVVDPGIGQSGPQVILSGSFPAPAAPGQYTFRLANALANVLTAVNQPPQFSPVAAATVNLNQASFSFTVGGPNICRGDLNCDAKIDFGDINPFVLRLSNPSGYFAQYPNCPNENGDINSNGVVGFDDINPFVTLLTSAPLPIPCP